MAAQNGPRYYVAQIMLALAIESFSDWFLGPIDMPSS